MDVYVQLSKTLLDKPKLIQLNGLITALNSDPDLASIPVSERAQAIQTLYVCTFCDYVSFFQGMGKITFLKAFFRYAAFILGRDILKQPALLEYTHRQNKTLTSFLFCD